jgi:NitT/TauT family transport system substrate-binding protein
MRTFTRRSALKATAAAGLATIGLRGAWAAAPAAGASIDVSWASINPGSFTTLVMEYMRKRQLDKKHGVTFSAPHVYTSVNTYYNDFVVGNYDMCMGSWDTFASRYQSGVPLQFVCAFTTGNMINILVPANGARTLEELKGKTIAATQATGTYRVTRALLKDISGLDIEKDMKVQNVDNPAAAVTLVMIDRADAVLVWEPNTSAALAKSPDVRVLYSAGDEYRKKTGSELPYFGVAVRKELLARVPEVAKRLDGAFAECVAGIMQDIDTAVDLVGPNAGVDQEVLRSAMKSGRLQFKHFSMADDAGRGSVKAASEMLVGNKVLDRRVDDGFFAKMI